MAAVIGFLTLLWTAAYDNVFWRLVIVRGWAGGAVTVSSLVLRTAVDLQVGVAVAMLAAIFLETGRHFLLSDSAQVPKLRAGRATTFDIVLPYMRSMRLKGLKGLKSGASCVRVSVVVSFITTTMLLQLTSTMLVPDLSLGSSPGAVWTKSLRFGFAY
jgi:hypothetical protein